MTELEKMLNLAVQTCIAMVGFPVLDELMLFLNGRLYFSSLLKSIIVHGGGVTCQQVMFKEPRSCKCT